jgi:hypothetical protein
VPDQPELKPGHGYSWKKVNNNHREIVNVDEIPSPDTTPVNPTPIVEETQQPTPEGMNIDRPTEVQEQQNQECRNPEGGATREHLKQL